MKKFLKPTWLKIIIAIAFTIILIGYALFVSVKPLKLPLDVFYSYTIDCSNQNKFNADDSFGLSCPYSSAGINYRNLLLNISFIIIISYLISCVLAYFRDKILLKNKNNS